MKYTVTILHDVTYKQEMLISAASQDEASDIAWDSINCDDLPTLGIESYKPVIESVDEYNA